MGRIKSLLIKRTAQQLYESIDIFSDNFEHNKKLLKNKMPSKLLGNKIAGQIVNLAKKKNKEKKPKKTEVPLENKED